MNITDIDDKIILRANERDVPWESLARQYEHEFFEDLASLQVRSPQVVPRVSEYIHEVKDMVQQLLDRGVAYEAADGVYFHVAAHPSYGRLAPASAAEAADADNTGADGKRDLRDFALWKRARPGEPSWDSPWGAGRPGWHIECSAMCQSIFGDELDLHTGGVDLCFPHHCNEIAQCEAAMGVERWPRHFA